MKFILLALVLVLPACGATRKKNERVDQVIDVFRQNTPRAEQCYKEALVQDPAVSGRLAIAWRVDHTGRARQARIVKSEVANKYLEDCVMDHLGRLDFPKQPRFSPAQVEYEFDFRKRSQAPNSP